MTKIKPSLPTRARRILASLCVAVAVFGPGGAGGIRRCGHGHPGLHPWWWIGRHVPGHVPDQPALSSEPRAVPPSLPPAHSRRTTSAFPTLGDVTSENANHDRISTRRLCHRWAVAPARTSSASRGSPAKPTSRYARQTSVSATSARACATWPTHATASPGRAFRAPAVPPHSHPPPQSSVTNLTQAPSSRGLREVHDHQLEPGRRHQRRDQDLHDPVAVRNAQGVRYVPRRGSSWSHPNVKLVAQTDNSEIADGR